jgi:hypothetical protein
MIHCYRIIRATFSRITRWCYIDSWGDFWECVKMSVFIIGLYILSIPIVLFMLIISCASIYYSIDTLGANLDAQIERLAVSVLILQVFAIVHVPIVFIYSSKKFQTTPDVTLRHIIITTCSVCCVTIGILCSAALTVIWIAMKYMSEDRQSEWCVAVSFACQFSWVVRDLAITCYALLTFTSIGWLILWRDGFEII